MAGVFYASGRGCDVDMSKALECWRAAVTQQPWIRYELPPDAQKEMPFTNLMWNIGVRESENAIGNAYRDGEGVDENLQTAAEVGPQ
jgi:hypothetical protein